jgi:hypothetical protein
MLTVFLVVSIFQQKATNNIVVMRRSREIVVQPRGRRADDGQWYVQRSPFPVYVYSAFYDDRPSLKSPQIAVIAKFNGVKSIDHCLLWFGNHTNGVSVPASVKWLVYTDMLVVCHLPARFVNRTVPSDAALAWTNKSTASGISSTLFRVPVEITRKRSTRGHLALCLAAVFRGDAEPRQIVEWLEMQRLLGVELVVVYNRSMSDTIGEVFSKYENSEFSDTGERFVEIRQSHTWLQGADSQFGHQTSTINDCMYRYMGSFRHIAVLDLDEVVVPRKNFTTIPHLITSLSARRTVASFLFRNVLFFVGPIENDNYSDVHRLVPASLRNSSFSVYLTRRRHATPSRPLSSTSPYQTAKTIVDANACVGMWVHFCFAYTDKFNSGGKIEQRMEVDVNLATKHHYRNKCNFEKSYPKHYPPGSCEREMKNAVVDNVIEKYSSQLVNRLLTQYKKLKLI